MRSNPEIMFIFPNWLNGNFDYHLGVNYIIAYLRCKGIYTEQFVIKKHIGLTDLVRHILARQPRIIGFTCYESNYYLVKFLSRQIKIKCPDILIIAGGPTVTFSDINLLKDIPEIDICIRGEGEYTTFELIQHLKDNDHLGNVNGITYRKNGHILRTQDRPFIKNKQTKTSELDIIPSPYLTGILKPEDFLDQNGDVSILTSRGCVYKCAYCNFSAMSKHTIRYHSIDRIIAELKIISTLKRTGRVFRVGILDDTFTINKKRTEELCNRIIKERIGLDFWAETRGDCVDEKLLRLLFNAGVRDLAFGLESAVPSVLYAMKKVRKTYSKKKDFIPEKRYIQSVKYNVGFAKKIGIRVGVNAMFGFPGETFKDGLKTLSFVNKLKANKYYHNPLKVYPGTELFASMLTSNSGGDRLIKKRRPVPSYQTYPLFFGYLYSEYDVRKLPLLDNEVTFNLHNEIMSYFLTFALMGISRKSASDYPEYVIFTGNVFPFRWIEKNLAFRSRVVYGKNIDKFIHQSEGNIKITIRSFAEILSLISTKKDLDLESLRKRSMYPTKNCLFLKLSQINKLSKRSHDTGLIFDIYDNGDIREMEERINLKKTSSILGFHMDIPTDCIILDACRWSSECSAIQMKRLIIDDDGDVRSCFQGEVIGNIDTPLKKIQEKLAALIKKIENERGCNSCLVRNRCSRCVFLGSISPDKYCSIMRSQSGINKFINSLNAARTGECAIGICEKTGLMPK